MDTNRRGLLLGAASLGLFWPDRSGDLPRSKSDEAQRSPWHPLTQSLLDRAAAAANTRTDTTDVQSSIARFAEFKGLVEPPIIKWLTDPADVASYLGRMGLDALLDMGTTTFWQPDETRRRYDERDLEATIPLDIEADRLVQFDEADRRLMEPKLTARMARSSSAKELLLVRAVQAQIGWLETCLAAVAVQAILDVELALQSGHCASDDFIRRQVCAFEIWEAGLLATWETPSEMICVPRALAPDTTKPGGAFCSSPGSNV